jgi:predicted 3-demethylubiquinone-9 3-methyltransferase (glyoxalase superfamily)
MNTNTNMQSAEKGCIRSSDRSRITPFLWFKNEAEEAARFYVSIFKNSRILAKAEYNQDSSRASGQPAGSTMTVDFELDGQNFVALNGGPVFSFTPAISFVVDCKDQAEVDYYWERLSEDGAKLECGWLTDKYGVSWQVVPSILLTLYRSENRAASDRVIRAMLQMSKMDIAKLQAAYDAE